MPSSVHLIIKPVLGQVVEYLLLKTTPNTEQSWALLYTLTSTVTSGQKDTEKGTQLSHF